MLFNNVLKRQEPTQKELFRRKFKNFVMDLKVRGFSEKTIDIYANYNGKFLKFIKKEPRSVTSSDIRRYLNCLVLDGDKPRTINMALNSLKAYYHGFLGKRLFKNIKRSKIPKDLPHILSKEEIIEMIEKTSSIKHGLLIELLYSSGMRVGECVKVRLEDIDVKEKLVFIKQGKGRKDRYTIISRRFVKDLRQYLNERKKYSEYLFDNGRGGHITVRAAEEAMNLAAKKAGIKKRVYPHLLRSCFATHLLNDGTAMQKVQKLLGHSHMRTTMGYARTMTVDIRDVKSPLD